MNENKRFKLIDGVKKGTHSGIWDNQKQHNQGIGDELWLGEVVGMLNEGVILAEEKKQLNEENGQLKQELQKIYEIATVNKVRDIVENVYDDLLYETSDESDYARKKVLKCLEDIDNLRDDMND